MKTKNPGVYITHKKDNSIYYRASLTYRRKHISLGSFQERAEAEAAYRESKTVLERSEITVLKWNENAWSLPYEKFISLINFRDNGIYFANPIYVRTKFFYYYYSPEIVLKFDMDDLFYYSSHKIMMRNHHLFVADYGMQVTITNRYGIMNYAVCGRDYVFVNNDRYDFRSANIKVINRFYGVTECKKKGTICYQAKVHVNGDYIVGYYETALEAAIAYNKACDILKRNGITKNFRQNETEGISPSVYANIYLGVIISEKIQNLNFDH